MKSKPGFIVLILLLTVTLTSLYATEQFNVRMDNPLGPGSSGYFRDLFRSDGIGNTTFVFTQADTCSTGVYKAFQNMTLHIYFTKDSTNWIDVKIRPMGGYSGLNAADITLADSNLFHFVALPETTTISEAGFYVIHFDSIFAEQVYFRLEGGAGGETGHGTSIKESKVKGVSD